MLALFRPFGIQRIVVGRAQANTGKEGTNTDSFTSVWGNNAWLGYVTPRPGRKEINGGYKFRLENSREVTKETFNNPPVTEVVVRDQYDHIIKNTECFYLIRNAVAAS